MKFSTVPLLFLLQISFIAIIASRRKKENAIDGQETIAVYGLLVIRVAWGIVSSYLSISGKYGSTFFLSLFPGFWLPLVPIMISLTAVVLFHDLRSGLMAMVDNTPRRYFVFIHSLRILAIGTILKANAGEFPVLFAYFVGVPDLIFGLSALYVGLHGDPSERFLMYWHLTGALVVTIPAMLLFQTGLPGAIQIFTEEPTTEKLLEFPMVLAPSLVVPMFILLNVMVFFRLFLNIRSRA